MKRIFLSTLSLVLLSLAFGTSSCKHAPTLSSQLANVKAPIAMLKKELDLVFVQENQRLPAHILYKREDRYAFLKGQTDAPFRVEMVINPLMRNPVITARVEKNGKTVRHFIAKKSATSILSEKKTSWTPTRSKLAVAIPYVAPNEVVVVTTSYEWMDIRWLPPLLMQEDDIPTMAARVTVDVPYGITMHFKAAKNRSRFDFLPESFPQEKSLWVQDDNRAGLGMRYVWNADVEKLSQEYSRADSLQVMLSFESPSQNDAGQRFDSWATISSYLYNRIDRYDMPSAEITSFSTRETRDYFSDQEKIDHILNFLRNNVEKRSAIGSFLEQEMQPATRTFARRFGTPSDVAILGKSMLTSIGIQADLIAAGDRRFNPDISDFHSPALFSSIILAYQSKGVTHYFDPEAAGSTKDQLQPNRQGQQALVLRPKNGTNFALPFDSAQKNSRTYSYQLWLNQDGVLEGEYSIDLMGFEAENAKRDGGEQLRSKNIAELEARLYGTQRSDFALESMEEFTDARELGLRVAGRIKPRLLFKNSQGGYDFKLEKIVEPAFIALQEAHAKGYSSTTKISLFIGLPENFVVSNLPRNQNISLGGIEGRFFVEANPGQLVVEGMAIVSLPLKNNEHSRVSVELEALKGFGYHTMAIHDEAIVMKTHEPQQTEPQQGDADGPIYDETTLNETIESKSISAAPTSPTQNVNQATTTTALPTKAPTSNKAPLSDAQKPTPPEAYGKDRPSPNNTLLEDADDLNQSDTVTRGAPDANEESRSEENS